MEIHQVLTQSTTICNVLCRYEQGEIFAAEGYARVSGSPGVCIATSGPGATNLVSGFANALLNSLPLVALTGQLHGYLSCLPKPPEFSQLEHILRLVNESKKHVSYVGGGCLNSSPKLHQFVELTEIPVASTLIGLGVYSSSDELSLRMLGMHGIVYANYAMDKRLICCLLSTTLKGISPLLKGRNAAGKLNVDYSAWRAELKEQKMKFPLSFKSFGGVISPQYAVHVLDELTNLDAIITTGVCQHQMWAAQWYNFKRPRQWGTSGGLGAMGFGLPAAIGAAKASPGSTVVDIDGDGSFHMNIQECFDIPAARATKKSGVRDAIQKMLETPGPYLLDVIVPHQALVVEHLEM
ncbi:hypothetical protein MRB53_013253 [Persea americana]|uniref:Uncharacterized protein n=1 Tax=Persea americana TaxID=3435 RepID=A0ACC2K7I8_PERAE|nr:hypothetical protein MRB53_013253 [Persea americana]